MVDAPGTTWGAIALWTWRRALPEIRIFSISCVVLIMMAIGFLLLRCSEMLECRFDCCGYLFHWMVAVYLFETALLAVVLDDWSGLVIEGLHALDEDGFGVVGALDEGGAIYITDAGNAWGIRVDVVDT